MVRDCDLSYGGRSQKLQGVPVHVQVIYAGVDVMYLRVIAKVAVRWVQRSPAISQEEGLEGLAEVFEECVGMRVPSMRSV